MSRHSSPAPSPSALPRCQTTAPGVKTGLPRVLTVITVCCLALYGWTLGFPMVFDDDIYLRENALFTQDHGPTWDFPALVKKNQDLGLNPDLAVNMILRPVAYLSFHLNHALGGFDPAGWRLLNVLIHAGNGLLLYLLIRRLLRDDPKADMTALTAAVLFTVHPMATESVTYIVQRFTSLAALFYLLALWAHFQANDAGQPARVRWRVLSVAASVLGMLTKECAATLPVMAVLLDVVVLRTPMKAALRRGASLLITLPVVPLMVLLATWAQHEGELTWGNAMYVANSRHQPIPHWHYLLTQFSVVANYLRKLVFPMGLNLDPAWPLSTSVLDWPVLRSAFLFMVVLGAAGWAWWRQREDRLVACLFAFVVWFFATISVSSGLVPLPDLMAEHRAYLPSAGIFIAVACLVHRVLSARQAVIALVTGSVMLSAFTVQRHYVWRTSVSLWEDTVAKSPGTFRPLANLAYQYMLAGQSARAITTYSRALEIDPGFVKGRINLAVLLSNSGLHRDAEKEMERLIEQHPELARDAMVVRTLSAAKIGRGRSDEAVQVIEAAAKKAPAEAWPHLALAQTHYTLGHYDKTLTHLREARSRNATPEEHQFISAEIPKLERLASR